MSASFRSGKIGGPSKPTFSSRWYQKNRITKSTGKEGCQKNAPQTPLTFGQSKNVLPMNVFLSETEHVPISVLLLNVLHILRRERRIIRELRSGQT